MGFLNGDCFATYETQREIKIPSYPIATTASLVKYAVIVYIMWAMFWEKTYQAKSGIESKVSTTVSGFLQTDFQHNSFPNIREGVYDASDLVIKDESDTSGGFIILTSMAVTPDQTQGKCPESSFVAGMNCSADYECSVQDPNPTGNGPLTGRCVEDSNDLGSSGKLCEIFSWCPVEKPPNGNKAAFEKSKNFIVFVKNTVRFPAFGEGYETQNIKSSTKEYLQTCIYHENTDKNCPRFRIGDIVTNSVDGWDFDMVARTGGEFAIKVNWDCTFGVYGFGPLIEDCKPQFSFSRLDDPSDYALSGFQFLIPKYNSDFSKRTLIRNIGLKIVIDVQGEGRRFEWVHFLILVGSSMGLLALSTTVGDLMLTACIFLKKCVCFKRCLTDYTEEMKYNLKFMRGRGQTGEEYYFDRIGRRN